MQNYKYRARISELPSGSGGVDVVVSNLFFVHLHIYLTFRSAYCSMVMKGPMKYVLDRQAVSERMKERGFANVSRFAGQIGVHRNTLLGYFRGKPVFASAFLKIAQALGCNPLELIVPANDHPVDLGPLDEIRLIIAALLKQSPHIAIVLLGSRAKGRAKQYADWDLGITRPAAPIGSREFLSLRGIAADLAEDLIRHVDVINLDAAPGWFWEGINYEPVFLDGDREGYSFLKGILHGIKKNRQAA
jgi:predicted nucleotidyltransferase